MMLKAVQQFRSIILAILLVLVWLVCAFLSGCTATNVSVGESKNLPPAEGDDITASNYSDTDNWAAISSNRDKPVDVFLLYPTTYQGEAALSSIDDAGMRERADGWLLTSGSAFETAGNLYMPYYRQLNGIWTLTLPSDEQTAYQLGAPKTDALAAFDYYIKNFNDSRPFILAAHSQGSTMVKEILFDYLLDNPEVADRMVAAYVIGYSVTEEDFERNPRIRFAEGPDDTGVVISWNTVAPDAEPLPGSVILPGALAINPISWTRSDKPSPASDNLGSYVDSGNGYEKVMGLADAEVAVIGDNYGVVICSTADAELYGMPAAAAAAFGTGSFHGADIQFYYFNLRENAERRVEAYLWNQR